MREFKAMRRRFKGQLQPVGDILSSALKRRGLAGKLADNPVFKLWPQAVGAKIARQTRPDGWRAGTLFVKTTSSVWVQQLHFMKEEILVKLNKLSGKALIKEIRFVVGHTLVLEKQANNISTSKRAVLKKRDKEMIAECTGSLEDKELADVLKRVMLLEISRRRQLENEKDR